MFSLEQIIKQQKRKEEIEQIKKENEIKLVSGVFYSWPGKEEKIFKHLEKLIKNNNVKNIKIYIAFNNDNKDNEYIQKTKNLLTEHHIEFSELNLKTRKMTGWKPKLYIYKQALTDHKKVLYMDLDMKLHKPIDEKLIQYIGKATYRFALSKRAGRPLNNLIYMSSDFLEYVEKAIKLSTEHENCDDELSFCDVVEERKKKTCAFEPIIYEYFSF